MSREPFGSRLFCCVLRPKFERGKMARNTQTPMEVFFPDGRIYEYYLQRSRLVASEKTPVLRVHDIRDALDSVDELPCIEVALRIPGLKIYNPVTGKLMILTDWLRSHFEGQDSQKGFLDAQTRYLGESIPTNHPEASLKPKFKHYRDGAPGDLPARPVLWVWYDELVRHLVDARKWLRTLKSPMQEFSAEDRAAFLKEISHPMFWWAQYIHKRRITLTQIARHSPRTTAMEILAEKFGKSIEAIKSRLRKEG